MEVRLISILCAVTLLLYISADDVVLSNANERIEINFKLSYESNSDTTMSAIWTIQKDKTNMTLISTWYNGTGFYITATLDDFNYHLITNTLPGNNTFQIQYTKLNESNPIQSNIYCKVINEESTIQRLIYVDLYPDENYYDDVNNSNFTDVNATYEDFDIDMNGTYQIILFSDEHFQIFDFDARVEEITNYYELIDFEKEYSQMNSVSTNIMIEDFSGTDSLPNGININVSNIVTEQETIEFEFDVNRTSQMKIRGSIKQCNFDVIYKEINSSSQNENAYMNGLNEFCNYPIPTIYDYTYQTEWLEIYLDEDGLKQQSPECRDSNHPFWYDEHINMCDTPTTHLTQYDNYNDVYTTVFACNNDELENGEDWYKWYYDIDQLTVFGYDANRVKITVVDYNSNSTYVAVSNIDSYPLINLRNNRSLSHPLESEYVQMNDSSTYYFNSDAWDQELSDMTLLEYMDNNANDSCDIYMATNESSENINYYSLDEYLYDNCNQSDEGILSIDFIEETCDIFGSDNVSIEIAINIGFEYISTGFVVNGVFDAISDNLDMDHTNLYAYGQHDRIQFYRFPDQFYEFSVANVSAGQYYQISFSFWRQCDDFTLQLYTLDGEEYVFEVDPQTNVETGTNITLRTLIWESVVHTNFLGEIHYDVEFMANAETMNFQFEFMANGLSTVDPNLNGCYIDIPMPFVIECIGGDDIRLCPNKQYNSTNDRCNPMRLMTSDNEFSTANGYCKSEYSTQLFTNPDANDLTWMNQLMTNSGMTEAWIGVERVLKSSANWTWVDDGTNTPYSTTILPICGSNDDGLRNPEYFMEVAINGTDWYSAGRDCMSKYGTHLASIHSATDAANIESLYAASSCDAYKAWIGLNDIEKEGIFEWTDETNNDYTNWLQGEPNDRFTGLNDCAQYMFANGTNGMLVTRCDNLLPCYICNGYYQKSCRYFDRSGSCVMSALCDQTRPFLCASDWDTKVKFDEADWFNLPDCIENKLKAFASIGNFSLSPVYKYEENVTIDEPGTGCIESSVGILSVEPVFEDKFGCYVEHDFDEMDRNPMYELFVELSYEAEDGTILLTNFTSNIYPNSIDDIMSTSNAFGVNIMHKLQGFDVIEEMLDKNIMINFEWIDDEDGYNKYYGQQFRYYKDDDFTSTVYPFYDISANWDWSSCDGVIQNALNAVQFSNMLKQTAADINDTIGVKLLEYSEPFLYEIPFESFIDDAYLSQSVDFRIFLLDEEDMLLNYASNLNEYPILVPTGFITSVSLSDNEDFWLLDLTATFSHCLSPGYAQLKIYSYNETSYERNLIYMKSILLTTCPNIVTFQFELPAIYFFELNNYNSTEMRFSNETFIMMPFIVEWDDLSYSFRMKPYFIVGNYQYSLITYHVVYAWNFIPLPMIWLIEETPFCVMFTLLISLSLLFLLLGAVTPKCKKDERYKINAGCIKCLKKKQPAKFVIDSTDTHINTLSHVFHVYLKGSANNRKGRLNRQKSLKVAKDSMKIRYSPFDTTLGYAPWVFLITITLYFCIEQFTDAFELRYIKNFDGMLFNKSALVLTALATGIGAWILVAIAAYLWCKYVLQVDFWTPRDDQVPIFRSTKSMAQSNKSMSLIEKQRNIEMSIYNLQSTQGDEEGDNAEDSQRITAKDLLHSDNDDDEKEKIKPMPTILKEKEYIRNKFDCRKHGLFICSDICCRLVNTFVFTCSFWFAFFVWYSSPETHAVLNDLPIALTELTIDMNGKLELIDLWQNTELNSMRWYYNNISIECAADMEWNSNYSYQLMDEVKTYHTDQMYPTIMELIAIDSWMRAKLTTILTAAFQAQYMGEVDKVMDLIKLKVDEGLDLMDDLETELETLQDKACLAVSLTLSLCSPLCGAIGGPVFCLMLEKAINAAKKIIEDVKDKFNEITDTAETPESDPSAGQTPKSAEDSDIDFGDIDLDGVIDDNDENEDEQSSASSDINHGEQIAEFVGVKLSAFTELPILNILAILVLIDGVIVYRKLIKIIKRAMLLQKGIVVYHDYKQDIMRISGWPLFWHYIRKTFGSVINLFLFIFPLIYLIYALYYTRDTIDYVFFEFPAVENFGLYQGWTMPVVTNQIKANELIKLSMNSYNDQLLPGLHQTMVTNIDSIQDTLDNFNRLQLENVTFYNRQKCIVQRNIAGFGDTFYCFQKYWGGTNILPPDNENIEIDSCTYCGNDMLARCMGANSFVSKEFTYPTSNYSNYSQVEINEFANNPFKSAMAEKRKFCQQSERIDWQRQNETIIVNATEAFETSPTLQCPDNMIISKINFKGDIDNSVIPPDDADNWYGEDLNIPYVVHPGGASWHNGLAQCRNYGSNLASIHSSDDLDALQIAIQNAGTSNVWIGLNDRSTEGLYEWVYADEWGVERYAYYRYAHWWDSTTYNSYAHWYPGQPDHSSFCTYTRYVDWCCWRWKCSWCCHCWCGHTTVRGRYDDAVYMRSDSWWFYAGEHGSRSFSCWNPNTYGIPSLGFQNSIHSIECSKANRGPLLRCMEFPFSIKVFTTPNHEFICEGAETTSGYWKAAWFLQGITFQTANIDSMTDLQAVIGVRCCIVPGTVYADQNEISPDTAISIVDENITTVETTDQSKLGIKVIQTGKGSSVKWFKFDTVTDYSPFNGGSIGYVDYNIFTDEDGETTPEINMDKMRCEEGCNSTFTPECAEEFDEDNPNPFVKKFECDEVIYRKSVMDYRECEINPVYPAFFYDYDKDKHKQMIIEQLSPYYVEVGNIVVKLWSTMFIFFAVKIAFIIWFFISQLIADKCYDGIHKRHKVKANMVQEKNPTDDDNAYVD